MIKVEYCVCTLLTTPPEVDLSPNSNATNRGIALAADYGAQVINMSFGSAEGAIAANYCSVNPTLPICLAMAHAISRDIAMVASSGNDRTDLAFPATESTVISAGGFQQNLAIWDDSPGSRTNCPHAANLKLGLECGSNFSQLHANQYLNRQELVGAALSVFSTTYPMKNWVDYAQCGDGYPVQWGNGVGTCTGTSMSAPQISGVVGLLRSINPLAPVGVPAPAGGVAAGVRTVLAQTTAEMQAGQGGWIPTLGYGHPDAALAAKRMLGKVAGAVIRNRATPLFRLYDSVDIDYADTTSPQFARELMVGQVHNYSQLAGLRGVPGYHFPYDPAHEAPPPTAVASAYVLTTEYTPRNVWPQLIPLYLMDRPRSAGITEYTLFTPVDVAAAHSGGYSNLRTIQGYIYKPCTPEPGCIPPVAERFYRECKSAPSSDCATFLEEERAAFESRGYTNAYPAGSSKVLGYAYPTVDTDGDGLPDGFEQVVGTDPTRSDSDGDVIPDGTEFPMVGVPVSDPCAGATGTGAKYCLADSIFKYGFEQL